MKVYEALLKKLTSLQCLYEKIHDLFGHTKHTRTIFIFIPAKLFAMYTRGKHFLWWTAVNLHPFIQPTVKSIFTMSMNAKSTSIAYQVCDIPMVMVNEKKFFSIQMFICSNIHLSKNSTFYSNKNIKTSIQKSFRNCKKRHWYCKMYIFDLIKTQINNLRLIIYNYLLIKLLPWSLQRTFDNHLLIIGRITKRYFLMIQRNLFSSSFNYEYFIYN